MSTKLTLSAEDFDVAKAVFEELKDIPRERQERVLRWISEGFGIAAVTHIVNPDAGRSGSSIPPTSGSTLPAVHPPSGTRDIKSFIAQKAPKSDMQFAAAAAYYYRFEAPPDQRKDAIDADVLQEAARLAGRNRLFKPLKTLNNTKSAGYLDTAGRGQFSINSVGENLVAMGLPANASTTSPKKARGKHFRKKGKPSPKKGARGKAR